MSDFQLTGSDPGNAGPGVRITRWDDMEGKTIRHVCDCPTGAKSSGLDAIIIFDDDCWATLFVAVEDTCDDASGHIDLCEYYSSVDTPLTAYMSPWQLLMAQMINQGQCDLLTAQQAKAAADEKAAKVARLRKQAEDLEKSS